MRVVWSAPAEADVDEIVRYIAEESLTAAFAQEDRIRNAVAALERHPRLGRPGRLSDSRELVVSGTPYLVIYYLQAARVEIVRILHGAQDWPPGKGS